MNIRKIAAVLALSAVGLWGQMTQMTGLVIGADGKPVQGAEVKIDRTDIKASYPIKTEKTASSSTRRSPRAPSM